MIAYNCLYSGQEEENITKIKFANLFSIVLKPSGFVGVYVMSFMRVALTP